MVDWPANYGKAPCDDVTLFFGGDTFCPELNVQTQLQDHYINAICAVAERPAT
jgi:hypothetical protein